MSNEAKCDEPTDDEIMAEAAIVLADCDLNVMTLKIIKGMLETKFDCDLSLKKEVIREAMQAFIKAMDDGEDDGEEEEAAPVKKKGKG